MAALAAVGHATERHLLRLFIDHAGLSPLHYLRLIRLERARQSLERGASVTHAAEISGFRSGLQLRRAWSRHWGGSPRDVVRAAPSMVLAVGGRGAPPPPKQFPFTSALPTSSL
jgi:transcriptional regulator GlxA family with amidase domain